MNAVATISIMTIQFTIIAVIGCLLAKALGVDEIVEEIERAHRRGNVHELRKRA